MTENQIDFSPSSPARENISKEFQKSRWKPFRNWFFKNFNKEEQILLLSNGEVTKSIFPPLQSFQINKDDKIIHFNVLSKLFEDNIALRTTEHINIMMKQHNYANIYMSILGEHITSIHDKKVANISIQPPSEIGNFKLKDFSDLEDFLEKRFKSGSLKPLKVDNLSGEENSHKKDFSDAINKISEKYARKLVQRIMLMYNTICKANKNSDKTIVDMITTGFTGQLKGWWDNYLNHEQRYKILQAVKQEGEQEFTQNVVYTLVLNIIEHFSGRWLDNSETIRIFLHNLRCKTLTSFRFYKDVFLSKVMELPECNSTHWKSKFINGLLAFFVERVRKTLRGENHSINYEDYSYRKLISACVQGLSLCNEIKLNQQIKRHCISERQQLGEFCEQFALDIPKASSKDKKHSSKNKSSRNDYKEFDKSDTCHKCGRFGHYAKDCRVKKKIKTLDIDDNIKESLCKIMLNSDSRKLETEYSSHEESSTREEDDLCKIYSEFKELSINVIDNGKVIKLLQMVKDPEIRAQIIDKISNTSTSKNHITEDIPPKEGSYTMEEIKNPLLERRKLISSPTTISDLKQEINNLEEDIHRLKEKNVTIELDLIISKDETFMASVLKEGKRKNKSYER
ncbi:hypothetical protein H5410_015094 [Solanum commersonii]|uniref:CCHC-type domain-containing protein n=1 Tax=Solanum commersonii TaxID=4109 RepID=A0A9J5ZSR7_SOLCO|nr:hypothetical protein H5410_015094 [Solanum commersonii]